MIVFRQKYPRWWYDWNLELLRFENRVFVYLGLMDDRYPSTDERQSVSPRLPVSRCEARAEPVASARQVVPCDPALHRADLPWSRRDRVRDHRLVRDPLHRSLPQGALRLRGRRHPLDKPGHRLRVHPGDRPVPAFPAKSVSRGQTLARLVRDVVRVTVARRAGVRPLRRIQGRADSARRASSSIFPCAASSLPTQSL